MNCKNCQYLKKGRMCKWLGKPVAPTHWCGAFEPKKAVAHVDNETLKRVLKNTAHLYGARSRG